MSLLRIAASACVLAWASLSWAQGIELPDWDNSVKFQLVASQEPIRPGDDFEIALIVDIEKGYHLYGPEEQAPSRTEIVVAGKQVQSGEPAFPPVVKRELEGLGTYDLYEGRIAIKVPLTLDPTADVAEHALTATVNYQVCTDFACSAPTSEEFSLAVSGASAGAPVERKHSDIFESK